MYFVKFIYYYREAKVWTYFLRGLCKLNERRQRPMVITFGRNSPFWKMANDEFFNCFTKLPQ